jgi:hypothetical protein
LGLSGFFAIVRIWSANRGEKRGGADQAENRDPTGNLCNKLPIGAQSCPALYQPRLRRVAGNGGLLHAGTMSDQVHAFLLRIDVFPQQ